MISTSGAMAATYLLPPKGEAVVGMMQETWIKPSETLLDVARNYDLGLNEVADANPGVDVWLPYEGQRIVVPTRFILPDAPYEGIVINLPEMRLYYYPETKRGAPRKVITHPIGIGAEGRAIPEALTTIIEKKIDPPWVVPDSIIAEHAAEGEVLSKVMPPGPDNPLGKYAMRLGLSTYLIHSTNRPASIGMRTSHGCLRMYPEDIEKMYPKVPLGTAVRIINQAYKAGWRDGVLYLEAHTPLIEGADMAANDKRSMKTVITKLTKKPLDDQAWVAARQIEGQVTGVPLPLTVQPAVQNAASKPVSKTQSKKSAWMVVQIGAFSNVDKAEHVGAMIRKMALPVHLGAKGKSKSCQVLVGPFPNRKTAESMAMDIQSRVDLEDVTVSAAPYTTVKACGEQK